MLEKFNRFCDEIRASLINEQVESSKFEKAEDMIAALKEKKNLEEFKKDNELIEKIKNTSKEVKETALDSYFEDSFDNGKQNNDMNQIYLFIKEFKEEE